MLDANLTAQLKAYLERVREPFEMVASLDDSENSRDMRTLLQQIAELSPLITLKTDGSDARKPSFCVQPHRLQHEPAFRRHPARP